MPTYRPVTADHRARFEEILKHAFDVGSGPDRDAGDAADDSGAETDEWPPALSTPRGVFDGERLVSVCKRYHLDAYLHDGFVEIGGLGGVATQPEHRREGHVRTLARGALEEYRDESVPIVALWPFSTPFYRHLGWGVSNTYTHYELTPEQLSFARGAPGDVRQLSPDDWERLRAVEVAFVEGTALSLRRSERWWRDRTLGAWPDDIAPYVYGYERGGELSGYVLYTIESGPDGRTLTVHDLAHADEEAYHGLLAFLSDHDSQAETLIMRRATETELLDRVDDPRAVSCQIKSGPMVRLTDVAAPLESYPWPDLDVEFTLSVSDPLLADNDGQFEVTVTGEGASVRRRSTGDAERGDADVTTDIATLSQLYVGTYDLNQAQRLGNLSVHRAALEEPLGAAFPDRPVCLREFF